MNTVIVYDIKGFGLRRRHRGNKDGGTVTTVLFYDEARNECFFNLNQRGLEACAEVLIGELRGETAQGCITGYLLENGMFRETLGARADRGSNGDADQETQREQHQNRDDLSMGVRPRQMGADWFDKNLQVRQRL